MVGTERAKARGPYRTVVELKSLRFALGVTFAGFGGYGPEDRAETVRLVLPAGLA
jgi:hypothetical protein